MIKCRVNSETIIAILPLLRLWHEKWTCRECSSNSSVMQRAPLTPVRRVNLSVWQNTSHVLFFSICIQSLIVYNPTVTQKKTWIHFGVWILSSCLFSHGVCVKMSIAKCALQISFNWSDILLTDCADNQIAGRLWSAIWLIHFVFQSRLGILPLSVVYSINHSSATKYEYIYMQYTLIYPAFFSLGLLSVKKLSKGHVKINMVKWNPSNHPKWCIVEQFMQSHAPYKQLSK